MALSTNIAPYYNDFDDEKNFHQILFRPGFAVQARELTQLQSILRGQIEKFGNHIFKQGSIVIPGNSRAELGVPYAKIESLYGGEAIDINDWIGQTVTGAISGVIAEIVHAEAATASDAITFYFRYKSGGFTDESTVTGKIEFDIGEDIYISTVANPIYARIKNETGATGLGSIAYINRGVYYVNGTFVTVTKQQVVISKYDVVPSCHVLLKITESIITADDDSTLLDPAQGSYNFAAPGADRLKIDLTLTTLPLDSVISDDYIEIMRYDTGVLLEHSRTPRYNELEKSLARRTFDESGNYVVSGLRSKATEHLRSGNNGGVSASGDINNYAITVSPGKAYVTGFEREAIAPTIIAQPKARTSAHVKLKEVISRPSIGRYIYISGVLGAPNINERQIIELWNDNDAANASATKVGEARVLAIDYHIGDPASNNAIYKLWVTKLTFNSVLYSMDDVGGIRYTGGSATVVQVLTSPLNVGTHNVGNIINYGSSVRTATVRYWDAARAELYVFKHDHTKATPRVGDQIVNATTNATSVVTNKVAYVADGTNAAIINLPVDSVKSLRNASNLYDYRYSVQKVLTLTTDGSGNGTVSIANGVIRTPDVGTFLAFSSTGIISTSLFALNAAGNSLSIAGGPTSTTIRIFATVDKEATIPRTKVLTQYIHTVTMSPSSDTVTLQHADVYRIVSITDDTGDVSENYDLDNGQTDYAYYLSSLTLRGGAPRPVGNLVVTYDYFQHSAGDFFIFDSYASNAGYEDFVLIHRSDATGIEYDLTDCIDLRPVVNASNDFTTGAVVGDMLISGELFTTSVQYYVPRYDLVVITVDGTIKVINGVPDENPRVPSAPADSMALDQIFIPAYTPSILDIVITRLATDRYTMQDISDISDRISRLEEFTTLSIAESSLVNYDVIDSETGLSRFKTGYVVESFDKPLTVANVYDEQFSAVFDGGSLIPACEEMICPVTVLDTLSSNYKIQNGILTLPYTETTLISQTLSSRVTNLNPFLVISWNGVLDITPKSDTWIEIVDKPEITIRRTETVRVTVPSPPPRAPAVVPPTRVGTTEPATTPPAPAPAAPLRTIVAFARDIGIVNPANQSDPNWNATVNIAVTDAQFNQFNSVAQAWQALPAGTDHTTSNQWAQTITALGTVATQAASITLSNGQSVTPPATSQAPAVIAFWQGGTTNAAPTQERAVAPVQSTVPPAMQTTSVPAIASNVVTVLVGGADGGTQEGTLIIGAER